MQVCVFITPPISHSLIKPFTHTQKVALVQQSAHIIEGDTTFKNNLRGLYTMCAL